MERHGRVVMETMESVVLRDNPLGDPHVRNLPVYLPPGYDEDTSRRYPVIFMLAGFTGFGAMMLNPKGWTEPLDRRMDRLIAAGRAQPAIVVLPDCFTRLGGSQYLDSSAVGRYETHVVSELVSFVDARFRTVAAPEGRALAGKSSGGFAAVSLAMRHPEVFGALASHSGDMYFEYCYLPDIPKLWSALRQHSGSPSRFLKAFDAMPRKTGDAIGALNVLAMSAAYSPDPDAAELGIALPFDMDTGELRADVWARWLEKDPVRMVRLHAKALEAMRLIFIDCGSRDQYSLNLGARIFCRRLSELGIDHVHEEFDDGHFDVTYRYDESLSRLSEALASG